MKHQLEDMGIRKIPRYAFLRMDTWPYPLPLSIRVHEWLFTLFPSLLSSFTLGAAIGISIHILLGPRMVYTIVSSAASTMFIFYHLYGIPGKIRKRVYILQASREPKEIETWEIGVEEF